MTQLGVDRVVDLQFGSGDAAYHVIVEFYAKGNIVLTDFEYTTLMVLRSFVVDDSVKVAVNSVYDTSYARQYAETSEDDLRAALAPREYGDGKAKPLTLKAALNNALFYGADLVEHAILKAGLAVSRKPANEPLTDAELGQLHASLRACETLLDGGVDRAYVLTKPAPAAEAAAAAKAAGVDSKAGGDGGDERVYVEFTPFVLAQHEGHMDQALEFATYSEAVDEFFSKVETQRLEQKRTAQQTAALKKMAAVRRNQEQHVDQLAIAQEEANAKAVLIEYNTVEVDAITNIVRSALASGVDWNELDRLIKAQKKAGDPLALMIHRLQLEENRVHLLLSNNLDDADEEALTAPVAVVAIDIDLSAYANARSYYDRKKKTAEKHGKAMSASEVAIKRASKMVEDAAKVAETTTAIRKIRKTYWFEKFNWFITSENYLVISGKDAQQNELVVKRYLNKGDVFVHASAHGAAATVVKNAAGADVPISPLSLAQAGEFAVCRSSAWDAKITVGAFWVHHHQVSKTAPTGEYLPTGSFMIRGKKNFLPPTQLTLGFGILFKLDDESMAAHLNERVRKTDVADGVAALDIDDGGDAWEVFGGDGAAKAAAEEEAGDSAADGPAEKPDDAGKADAAATPADAAATPAAASGAYQMQFVVDDEDDEDEDGDEDEEEGEEKARKDGGEEDEDEDGASSDGGTALSSTPSTVSSLGGARMSAAQRRRAKKEKKRQEAGLPPRDDGDDADSDGLPAMPLSKKQAAREKAARVAEAKAKAEAAEAATTLRGKKGKLKRMKKKYADQDEEERQLRMALNAAEGTGETTKKQAIAAKALAKAAGNNNQPGKKGGKGKGKKGGKGKGKGKTLSAEELEVQQLLKEENIRLLTEEEKGVLSELASLTAQPRADDILHFAIPVCGPYSAFSNYKFKVKLQPGPQKRGKAAQQARHIFSHAQDCREREKELMAAVPDPEVINAMASGVKLSVPGMKQLLAKGGKKKGQKKKK